MNLKSFWPFNAPAAESSPESSLASSLPKGLETVQETVHPSAESLSAVFSSYSPVEAHIVSEMLEDNGIEWVLRNELFAAADGPVANATGGGKVFVRASDTDQAHKLMREATQDDLQEEQP